MEGSDVIVGGGAMGSGGGSIERYHKIMQFKDSKCAQHIAD